MSPSSKKMLSVKINLSTVVKG